MKIVRFDAPNHAVKEISIILTAIGYRFLSYDEIYWLVGIDNDSDVKSLCAFFEAVGFKNVMAVSTDEDCVKNKEIETITLTKYVLVYVRKNGTFCYSSVKPTREATLFADYIYAPGNYPIPMKDRHTIFSDSHQNIPSDVELKNILGYC